VINQFSRSTWFSSKNFDSAQTIAGHTNCGIYARITLSEGAFKTYREPRISRFFRLHKACGAGCSSGYFHRGDSPSGGRNYA
jgi:hypothetical protein